MVASRKPTLALLALACGVLAQCNETTTTSDCKCFPGDDCWPTAQEWSDFNATSDGRLIATVPLAAACHDDVWASYNNATCTKMQNSCLDPETQ